MDGLTLEEREKWDVWVAEVRRTTLQTMDSSAMIMQLYTDKTADVKFALEVGYALLLDKPILAVVLPGALVPKKLGLVADLIVEADIETEEGRAIVAAALEAWKGT